LGAALATGSDSCWMLTPRILHLARGAVVPPLIGYKVRRVAGLKRCKVPRCP